jgi:hypothetical protein
VVSLTRKKRGLNTRNSSNFNKKKQTKETTVKIACESDKLKENVN